MRAATTRRVESRMLWHRKILPFYADRCPWLAHPEQIESPTTEAECCTVCQWIVREGLPHAQVYATPPCEAIKLGVEWCGNWHGSCASQRRQSQRRQNHCTHPPTGWCTRMRMKLDESSTHTRKRRGVYALRPLRLSRW